MILALDPRIANAPTYKVYRNGAYIGEYKGIQDHDNVGDYIDFIHPNKIAIGDKIVNIAGKEYSVTGIDCPQRTIGGLSTNQYFKVYYTASQSQSPLVNNTINITNNNSAALNNTVDMSIIIQNVENNIKGMSALSDDETKLALEKVNELAEIIKSKESRKSKWSKIASALKWLADKSVDLACAFAPMIMQVLQSLH